MTNGNDPNDDAGNRALDYATDNVEAKLAGMDLEELCEASNVDALDLLDIMESFVYDWEKFRHHLAEALRANENCRQQVSEKLQEQHRAGEE